MLNTQLVYLQLDLLVVLQVPGGQVHQVDPSERNGIKINQLRSGCSLPELLDLHLFHHFHLVLDYPVIWSQLSLFY